MKKIIPFLQISITPLILMAYGWHLGQLHQSGYDIAGILLFFTGAVGFVLGLIVYWYTRKFSWHNKWFANILTGTLSCGIVFGVVMVYTSLHG